MDVNQVLITGYSGNLQSLLHLQGTVMVRSSPLGWMKSHCSFSTTVNPVPRLTVYAAAFTETSCFSGGCLWSCLCVQRASKKDPNQRSHSRPGQAPRAELLCPSPSQHIFTQDSDLPSLTYLHVLLLPPPPEGPSSHSPSVTSYSSFLDRKSHPSSQSHQCLALCGPLQLPKLPPSQHTGIVTVRFCLCPPPPPGTGPTSRAGPRTDDPSSEPSARRPACPQQASSH